MPSLATHAFTGQGKEEASDAEEDEENDQEVEEEENSGFGQ